MDPLYVVTGPVSYSKLQGRLQGQEESAVRPPRADTVGNRQSVTQR